MVLAVIAFIALVFVVSACSLVLAFVYTTNLVVCFKASNTVSHNVYGDLDQGERTQHQTQVQVTWDRLNELDVYFRSIKSQNRFIG